MDKREIDEVTLREYLLGRMEHDHALVAEIDKQIITDPEFFPSVEIVEDEIIEEYLEGSMSAVDKQAVERHFLRPPERQRKLKNTRLLSRHLAAAPLRDEATQRQEKLVTRAPGKSWPRFLAMPGFRTCAEVAASLLFAVAILYFWNQQRELRLTAIQSRQELAQWKQKQAGSPIASPQAVAMISLVVPGLRRGEQPLPESRITPDVATLHATIALSVRPVGALNVRVRQGGTVLWSTEGVSARLVTGGALLAVDIPASAVTGGKCEVIVTDVGGSETSYWFRAIRTQ